MRSFSRMASSTLCESAGFSKESLNTEIGGDASSECFRDVSSENAPVAAGRLLDSSAHRNQFRETASLLEKEFVDFSFALGQRLEDLLNSVPEHLLCSRINWRLGCIFLLEIPEMAVFALAHRSVDTNGCSADLKNSARFLHRRAGRTSHLFNGQLAAQFLDPFLENFPQSAHHFDHVAGNVTHLIREGPGDGLPNPPHRVGAAFPATSVIELVHCPDQARVAFLSQIEGVQSTVAILAIFTASRRQLFFADGFRC